MRRTLASVILAAAALTVGTASARACDSKAGCARETVLRALDCAVKLQPPCIYYG